MSEPASPTSGSSGPPPETPAQTREAAARFGIVLLLLLITYVFLASAPTGRWVPFAAVFLQGATLLAALAASNVNRRLWRIAEVVVAIGLIAAAGVWFVDFENADGVLFVMNALLVGAAPVAIAMSLVRRHVVDIHTVMGALCIYVLVGMLWSFTFGAIGEFGSGPFFAQKGHTNVADYLYFSFVTLTTVGYGDLTAASGLGRAVAVVEALTGQLYLVTVVSLVVSRMARARRPWANNGGPEPPD